jgi:hypothetical protein
MVGQREYDVLSQYLGHPEQHGRVRGVSSYQGWKYAWPQHVEMLLTVYIRIKFHMDLQADKSPIIVKGPFFPRVVNPRYRIRGTMCNARIQSSKVRKAIFLKNQDASNLRDHPENTSNLIN